MLRVLNFMKYILKYMLNTDPLINILRMSFNLFCFEAVLLVLYFCALELLPQILLIMAALSILNSVIRDVLIIKQHLKEDFYK